MNKATTKTLVPKLRFPEFLDNKGWKEIKFFDVADKKIKWSFIGGPFGSNLKSSDYVEEGVRVIQLQNIGDAEFINNYEIFTSEEKANELLSNNIYPGNIILSKMGDPVGRACLIPETHSRYVMCSDGIRLVVDEELYSKYFIYSLINAAPFRSLIEKTATGSTRKRIGLSELKNLTFLVPRLKGEQQKIADCLSSIDELITAHTQKHEVLKAHKKGLIQQLFPADGETVPKLRFPEFRGAGEWEEKPLKKVFSIFQGFAFSSKDSVTEGARWLKIADVSIQKMNHSKPSYLPAKYKTTHERFSVKEGDYVIALTRPILSKQLKIAPVDKVFHGALLNQRVGKLVTTQHIVFVYYLLQTSKIISDIEKSISGSEPPNLSAQQIEYIKTCIPSEKEQKKIANCLSSVDELITAQAQKTELLKAHKKGLMQQLFPATNKVGA